MVKIDVSHKKVQCERHLGREGGNVGDHMTRGGGGMWRLIGPEGGGNMRGS